MSHLNPTDEERNREQLRLPGWALDTIDRLRAACRMAQQMETRAGNRADELEAKLAEYAAQNTGPADSTAWLWREDGGEELPRLGLGDGAAVVFTPPQHSEITVEVSGGGIRVKGDGDLVIYPLTGRDELYIEVK